MSSLVNHVPMDISPASTPTTQKTRENWSSPPEFIKKLPPAPELSKEYIAYDNTSIFASNKIYMTNKHYFAFCCHGGSVTEKAELYPIDIERGIKQINYITYHNTLAYVDKLSVKPPVIITPKSINNNLVFRIPALLFSISLEDMTEPDYFLNMGIWYLYKPDPNKEYSYKRILDFKGMLELLGDNVLNTIDVLLNYISSDVANIINMENDKADIGIGCFCCRNILNSLAKPLNPEKPPAVLFDLTQKPYIFDLQKFSKKKIKQKQYNHYAYPLLMEAPDETYITSMTTDYPLSKIRKYASALNVLSLYGIIDVAYANAAVTCLRNETSIFKTIEFLRYNSITTVNLKWNTFNMYCIIRYSPISLVRYFELIVPLLFTPTKNKTNKHVIMKAYDSQESANENYGYTFSIFFSATDGKIYIIDPVNTSEKIPIYQIYDCYRDFDVTKIVTEIEKFLKTLGFNPTNDFLFDTLHIFTSEKSKEIVGTKITNIIDAEKYIRNFGGIPVEYPSYLNHGGNPDTSSCPLDITNIKIKSNIENHEPSDDPEINAFLNDLRTDTNSVPKQTVGGKKTKKTKRNKSYRKSKRNRKVILTKKNIKK